MISLKDFMECINYRITEGSDYMWKCYGDNVHQIESTTPNYTVCIVFDTQNQFVYEMEVWDYLKDRTYRWISPGYVDVVKKEYKVRGLKFKQCIDDREYIRVKNYEKILRKAKAVVNGW